MQKNNKTKGGGASRRPLWFYCFFCIGQGMFFLDLAHPYFLGFGPCLFFGLWPLLIFWALAPAYFFGFGPRFFYPLLFLAVAGAGPSYY